MDKLLALKLNRASSFRDKDVTVPYATCGIDEVGRTSPLIPKWIRMSQLQGRVYEDLYSPGALLLPGPMREAQARSIAEELVCIFETVDEQEASLSWLATSKHILICGQQQIYHHIQQDLGATVYELLIRADKVSYFALLAHIYRSYQSNTNGSRETGLGISQECLFIAKACLEEHKICLSLLKRVEVIYLEYYVQW